jgi:divalent metal cation (Fe/Co/Zn/Cd) transporter
VALVILGAGSAGVAVAFLGVALGQVLDSPYPDAVASLVIALILASIAVFLVRESRDLLVGERAEPELVESVREIVNADEVVERAADPLTMHLGPHEILLNLEIQFRQDLCAGELEGAIERIESTIRDKHPEVKRIFLEIRSLTHERREAVQERADHAR